MKSRSIFILCTFILLFIINKISLHKDIKNQNEDLSIVNISGRQRMYSQKISKIALLIKENSSTRSSENKSNLKKITLKFSKAHATLKTKYLKKYNDFYLSSLFEQLEPNYVGIITNSNLLTQKNTSAKNVKEYVNQIDTSSVSFLPIMDKIVKQYEIIGINRGKNILNRELTFNIIITVLSIYTVFFLIFPLINGHKENEL